jgi:segregation and condensation protein B
MSEEVSNPRLKSILESLLFVANRPLTAEEIAPIIGIEPEMLSVALQELLVEYEGRGIHLAKIAGGWQMVTTSENSNYVEAYLNSPIVTTLSPAALETLAVVSYKQPVTKLDVENIRGVNSDGVINTLLEKRMIREIGRGDGVGRPILYGTTVEFLRHFGLKDLGDLPALPEGTLEQTAAFREGTILPPEVKEEEGHPVGA